jgi:DNA polymerase V
MVMGEKQIELRVTSVSRPEAKEHTTVPLYLCRVSAGFPSPASDYVERDIDLNEWLIRNKLATYVVRVEGDSMAGEIHPDDRLIVDRSLKPRHRDVVVACIDGRCSSSG